LRQCKVVVTGMGTVNPLGCSVSESWQNTANGVNGISNIRDFDASGFSTQFAGQVPTSYEPSIAAKEAKKCDPFIQYGISACDEAIMDAGLAEYPQLDKDRVGVIMGSGIGGLGTIENNSNTLAKSGPRRINPFFIPASIINLISGRVSIKHGYRGANLALATACTTGTHAIGLAHRLISYGDADVIIAGAAEKASTPLGLGGFCAARALSTRNDSPETASRPWDRDRDGFVLGDGAGALVLESLEHAQKRGAKILAELSGFAMSSDAYHITRPPAGALGAQLCMQNSLIDAGINASEVGYINAHSTSTIAGDIEESIAIQTVMGEHAKNVLVSSTKSMTGHLLGAAGAIEAIFTIMALNTGIIPPTINLDNVSPGCDLDYVPNKAREQKINVAVSNSFGFGGTNGTIVFKKTS